MGWRGVSPLRSGGLWKRGARIAERAVGLLPAGRQARLTESVTIDLDATDVEVYGRKKRGVAYTYQGQRAGRPHVATWAETETVLAAELLAGDTDPRAGAAGLLRRAVAGLARRVRGARVRLRADAGYFAGELARAAAAEGAQFAIGAKRIALLWRLWDGIAEDAWADAIVLGGECAGGTYRDADGRRLSNFRLCRTFGGDGELWCITLSHAGRE